MARRTKASWNYTDETSSVHSQMAPAKATVRKGQKSNKRPLRYQADKGPNKMPFLRKGGGLKVYNVKDLPPESKLLPQDS